MDDATLREALGELRRDVRQILEGITDLTGRTAASEAAMTLLQSAGERFDGRLRTVEQELVGVSREDKGRRDGAVSQRTLVLSVVGSAAGVLAIAKLLSWIFGGGGIP